MWHVGHPFTIFFWAGEHWNFTRILPSACEVSFGFHKDQSMMISFSATDSSRIWSLPATAIPLPLPLNLSQRIPLHTAAAHMKLIKSHQSGHHIGTQCIDVLIRNHPPPLGGRTVPLEPLNFSPKAIFLKKIYH